MPVRNPRHASNASIAVDNVPVSDGRCYAWLEEEEIIQRGKWCVDEYGEVV